MNGQMLDFVFPDFENAVDSVNHRVVRSNLNSPRGRGQGSGVPSIRHFRMLVNGQKADLWSVVSGVACGVHPKPMMLL